MVSARAGTGRLSAPVPEDRLVQQAVAGDAESFARLYDAYVARIYRYAYFRVRDRQTAEDLTSQVFLKAWDHLDRCHTRRVPFGNWLFAIARNTLIDHYRTARPAAPLDFDPAAPASDEWDQAERREAAESVRRALRALTPDQRDVLTLKFVEGLSTGDVAQVMGKRPGAVRALQMRGLQALAALLRPARDRGGE